MCVCDSGRCIEDGQGDAANDVANNTNPGHGLSRANLSYVRQHRNSRERHGTQHFKQGAERVESSNLCRLRVPVTPTRKSSGNFLTTCDNSAFHILQPTLRWIHEESRSWRTTVVRPISHRRTRWASWTLTYTLPCLRIGWRYTRRGHATTRLGEYWIQPASLTKQVANTAAQPKSLQRRPRTTFVFHCLIQGVLSEELCMGTLSEKALPFMGSSRHFGIKSLLNSKCTREKCISGGKSN